MECQGTSDLSMPICSAASRPAASLGDDDDASVRTPSSPPGLMIHSPACDDLIVRLILVEVEALAREARFAEDAPRAPRRRRRRGIPWTVGISTGGICVLVVVVVVDVSAPGGFDAGSRATELGVHERDGDAHRAIMCPSPSAAARVLNEEALLGKEVTERKYLPGHVKGGSIFLELSVTVHPRGCIAAAMTTIWRPHWLVKHIEPVKEEVPDDDVPDVKVEPPAGDDGINGEDGTTPSEGKGAKRKRAPRTKGPCEHGVKYRSKCKVCSACPHGRRRSRCKECGGQESASTVVGAQMQGVRWGINLRARSSALLLQGVRWGWNLRARSSALSVQGVRWGINLRARSYAL